MDPIDLIQEGKIKRYFRAKRKLNAPNLVSHITQRAAGKDLLFIENDDFLFMLTLLKEISESYDLSFYAFCLMPNHTHFLFSPKKENLYDAMRDLFSRYAMRFNRKYERKGHLFGGPYRQAICLDDSYLLAVSLYIHLNPVKAGLSNDPVSYRWSSCRLYYADDAPRSFINPDFILDLLSEDRCDKKERYRKLLGNCPDTEFKEVLEEKDAIERFLSRLSSKFPFLFKEVEKKKRIAEAAGIDLLSLEALERQIEKIKQDNIPKPDSNIAKKYVIEQLISRGYKRAEIAERLCISRKTIYNILNS